MQKSIVNDAFGNTGPNVLAVRTGAFQGCTNLEIFSLLCYQSPIVSYNKDAFNGCTSLRNVFFNAQQATGFATGSFANCILRVDQSAASSTPGYSGKLLLGYNNGQLGYGYQSFAENAFQNTRILDGRTLQDIEYNVIAPNTFYFINPADNMLGQIP